jgi:hypothetical protein
MLVIAGTSTQKVLGILAAGSGLAAALEALNIQQGLTLPRITPQQIIAQNVTPEVSDLSTVDNYPLVYVYCTKVVNRLREKFRPFPAKLRW